MPRPRRCRRIRSCPKADLFKPRGVRLREIETINLAHDEYEAIRLVIHEKLDQQTAATKMDVSQPTLNRILKSGEQKLASMIIEGKALHIGGEKMPNKDGTGPDGEGPMTGRKMGPCNPDKTSTAPRRGMGRGAGRGRGMGLGR